MTGLLPSQMRIIQDPDANFFWLLSSKLSSFRKYELENIIICEFTIGFLDPCLNIVSLSVPLKTPYVYGSIFISL